MSFYDYCVAEDRTELLNQWATDLNLGLTPRDVTARSDKKAWWICEKGHRWKTDIRTRTRGSGCPVCAHRTIVSGINTLAATHPVLAAQWHPTRNGNLKPQDVFAGDCRRKAWWVCEKGHEWQAAISSRRTSGCPYCTGKSVLPGFNDLASQMPDAAKDWHPTLNENLTPKMVTVNSNKKVWWQCHRGHAYQSPVAGHTTGGRGCPYCSNRIILPGFNDLATMHPAIAAQWHPTLNGELAPRDVMAGSNKKAWWQCNEGHVWKSYIFSRTGPDKCGCPVCAGFINKKRAEKYRAMLAEAGIEWKPDSA